MLGLSATAPPLAATIVFLLLQALALAVLGYSSALRPDSHVYAFTLAGFAAGAAYLGAVYYLPRRLTRRAALALVLVPALLLRLLLLPAEPGDDLWRYLWEGAIQLRGYNPYVLAPSAEALAPLRAEYPFWSRVGHPEWSAIYPPLTQLLFRDLAALAPSVLLFKSAIVLADLAVLALLWFLVRRRARAPQIAALYAWNPLILHSFAGAGHFDSLMLLPLLGAYGLLMREWRLDYASPQFWTWRNLPRADFGISWTTAAGVALLLGMAIAIKLAPLALVPAFALALGRRWPALLLAALPLPLLALLYGFPAVPIWHSLTAFADVSRTNALLWWVTEHLWQPDPWGRNRYYNYAMLLAAAAVVWVQRRNPQPARLLFAATAAVLLLTHTLHPWYLTWLIPWACLLAVGAPGRFTIAARVALIASISVFGYFLHWAAQSPWWQQWEMHPAIWALQVLPPVAALVWLLRIQAQGTGQDAKTA